MADETDNTQNTTEESVTEDDWTAAMAEQTPVETAATGNAQPADIFPSLGNSVGGVNTASSLEMISDIPVQITVELGRTKIAIQNLLQLTHGSVVELDSVAGEPMSVYVNGTLVAHGEVVVVNDKLGVRLTDIIMPSERVRKTNR